MYLGFALLLQPHVHIGKDENVFKKDQKEGRANMILLGNKAAGWERTRRPTASAANNHRQ